MLRIGLTSRKFTMLPDQRMPEDEVCPVRDELLGELYCAAEPRSSAAFTVSRPIPLLAPMTDCRLDVRSTSEGGLHEGADGDVQSDKNAAIGLHRRGCHGLHGGSENLRCVLSALPSIR